MVDRRVAGSGGGQHTAKISFAQAAQGEIARIEMVEAGGQIGQIGAGQV
jgi:hypothetical protein